MTQTYESHCLICGAEVMKMAGFEALNRPDYHCDSSKFVWVSSEEAEQIEFQGRPFSWNMLDRGIFNFLGQDHIELLGIGISGELLPMQPGWALLKKYTRVSKRPHPHPGYSTAVEYNLEVANITESYVKHSMHAHCWLLIDRVIGHDIIKADLRGFVSSAVDFWKRHPGWANTQWIKGHQDKAACDYKQMIRENRPRISPEPACYMSGSPFRIPAIQQVIAKATQSQNEDTQADRRRHAFHRSRAANIPLDIVIIIVEMIRYDFPYSPGGIRDTENLLKACGWRLPDTYWRTRCNIPLLFEVEDLIRSGKQADWAGLCLGLEKLLSRKNWYCESGLKHRSRALVFPEMYKHAVCVTTEKKEADEKLVPV